MTIKYADAAKDPKIMLLLKAFMVSEHNSENYNFLASRDSNEKLYANYISPKAKIQINLPGDIQKPLDALAAKKQWSAMATGVAAARRNITDMINADVMPRFERSKGYVDYLASKTPKPPDLTAAKAAVVKMEKDITEGSAYYTTAIKSIQTKGLPANRDEVNRMFDSGRMRHDKVHTPYTTQLQKDKAFTKANFAAFFTKKETFSKQWADYRKLLGR